MVSEEKPKCFVIMPITTPKEVADLYNGDTDHFVKILEHLFIPAIENAGFTPISPKSTGSDVIHADVIMNISTSALVLCDMSILNPNVFFEFGIRSALDKPVALVVDDMTNSIPFDTSIVHFHRYKSSPIWEKDKEIIALTAHISNTYEKSEDRNALWKYFGITQTGVYRPEDSSLADKIDYLIKEMSSIKGSGGSQKAARTVGDVLNFKPRVSEGVIQEIKECMAEPDRIEHGIELLRNVDEKHWAILKSRLISFCSDK